MNPDSGGQAMCALMAASRLAQRFAQGRFAEHHLPARMSGPRMGVLFAVRGAGAVRMGDLASRLGVAPRTVTDLVDGMERDGLLIRKSDPADRRATLLELAPEAAADFDRMRQIQKSFIAEIFSPLTPGERRALVRLLNKLSHGPIGQMSEVPWEGPPRRFMGCGPGHGPPPWK